jgi:hypothetical protein
MRDQLGSPPPPPPTTVVDPEPPPPRREPLTVEQLAAFASPVEAVLAVFPGSVITRVRVKGPADT